MQKRGRTHPVMERRQKRILALADGTRSRRDIADEVGVSVEDIDHDLHTLRRQGHSPQLLYTRGRRSTQDNEARLKARIAKRWAKELVCDIAMSAGVTQARVREIAAEMGLGAECTEDLRPRTPPWPEPTGMRDWQIAWAKDNPDHPEAKFIIGMSKERPRIITRIYG